MTQTFELTLISAKALDDPLGRIRGLLAEMRGCEVREAAGQFMIRARLVVTPTQERLWVHDVHGAVADTILMKTRQITLTKVVEAVS
jgi:hypothetical protein